ncbi:terminase small subunit [Tomitella fengzijianii]|uniref:Terminase small subunit actinomycetes phage-type domain-containing protein n=1 Tax=Tomitella fengzijianii TaxID=2597660 RepID=A0A516X4J0_9ACTN|nr:hypothetical protein [Tomitella fengzijianii]QDQ97974.1 hypothetical protein FO059_12425 [Tomitella fengzijianii]
MTTIDTDTGLAASTARAVARMTWLTDTDQATVDLAMRYAHQIDAALERGGQDATKGMHLGPHLLRALDTLGGTPAGRKAIESGDDSPTSALARMRSARRSGA